MRAPATAFLIFIVALGSPPGAWAADSPAALYRQALAATCANCHGTNGQPIAQPAVPGLAGTPVNYFKEQMQAFKTGQRTATVMHQIAKGFSEAQIDELAAYFATLPR
ncbi:cytochrome c553 [Burkholderiales bacterium JOSHI_001]|nr:cytochrome c553 [Burkholderiales bacterium JOSHI_001]